MWRNPVRLWLERAVSHTIGKNIRLIPTSCSYNIKEVKVVRSNHQQTKSKDRRVNCLLILLSALSIVMSAILHPGLYTIQQVISRDEGIFAYASARRHPGAPLVGSPDLSPEFIQHVCSAIPSPHRHIRMANKINYVVASQRGQWRQQYVRYRSWTGPRSPSSRMVNRTCRTGAAWQPGHSNFASQGVQNPTRSRGKQTWWASVQVIYLHMVLLGPF